MRDAAHAAHAVAGDAREAVATAMAATTVAAAARVVGDATAETAVTVEMAVVIAGPAAWCD